MARYKVEFRALKTGKWYTKTETDSRPAAFSVAMVWRGGRASRLTDTETGKVIYEAGEDYYGPEGSKKDK